MRALNLKIKNKIYSGKARYRPPESVFSYSPNMNEIPKGLSLKKNSDIDYFDYLILVVKKYEICPSESSKMRAYYLYKLIYL